jgi:hypothetical protein
MGPRLLFDKSFLQSLSLDEAVLLDHFFCAVISPIFYVETLADLEKTSARRSPDDEVRIISSKIPNTNSAPMLFHPAFAVRELMGTPVLMDGRMFLSGAKTVAFRGQKGIVQNPGPEHGAFERWQNREFLSPERSFARSWRQKLRRVDLSTLKAGIRAFGFLQPCTSLEQAHGLALQLVNCRDHQRDLVKLALIALGANPRTERRVLERWNTVNQPALTDFAPYASFILRVEAFFAIAHEYALISYDPNSRSDITYFHYVPFCNVFVSSDRLQLRTAKFFLRSDQTLVHGPVLKQSLGKLVDRYLALPDEEKDKSLLIYARTPPIDDPACTVAELWDRHEGRKWRDPAPALSPQLIAALEGLIKEMEAEQVQIEDESDLARVSSVQFKRHIPEQRGSFRLVAKGTRPSAGSAAEPASTTSFDSYKR